MTSVLLRIAYDGTEFHGFAESDGVRTVAGSLRRIVREIALSEQIVVRGASRTDAGVHALDQCVRIDVESTIDAEVLGRALSALVPPDISIHRCIEAPPDFQPSIEAIEKRYVYRVWNSHQGCVLGRRRLWRVGRHLDLESMVQAAKPLVGTHDFAGFQNRSRGGPESTVRTVSAVAVRQLGPEIWFQVIGDGFLYRMVRNIVGTLVEVGRGSMAPESVTLALESKDRTLAGQTAPAHGLHLAELRYPGEPECAVDEAPLRF